MQYLQGLLGIAILFGIAFLISDNRRKIRLRPIIAGTLLQFGLAYIFFQGMHTGKENRALAALDQFVNGYMALFRAHLIKYLSPEFVDKNQFLCLGMLGIVAFALISAVLFQLGIGQLIIRGIGWAMRKIFGVSGAELGCAITNILWGPSESALVVGTYIPRMTRSELFCVMVSGLATVAGSVLVLYTVMLSGRIEGIGGHLAVASVLAAPAAIVFSKIIIPEDGVPETAGAIKWENTKPYENFLDAMGSAPREGLILAAEVFAIIVGVPFLIDLWSFLWLHACQGITAWTPLDLSGIQNFQVLVGYLFAPFAWIMGVPTKDCIPAGVLLGEKTVFNELVAYRHFADILDGAAVSAGYGAHQFDPKSKIILAYALCGFSNFLAIVITGRVLKTLAPERKDLINSKSFCGRALVASTFACFMMAIIAGMLF